MTPASLSDLVRPWKHAHPAFCAVLAGSNLMCMVSTLRLQRSQPVQPSVVLVHLLECTVLVPQQVVTPVCADKGLVMAQCSSEDASAHWLQLTALAGDVCSSLINMPQLNSNALSLGNMLSCMLRTVVEPAVCPCRHTHQWLWPGEYK